MEVRNILEFTPAGGSGAVKGKKGRTDLEVFEMPGAPGEITAAKGDGGDLVDGPPAGNPAGTDGDRGSEHATQTDPEKDKEKNADPVSKTVAGPGNSEFKDGAEVKDGEQEQAAGVKQETRDEAGQVVEKKTVPEDKGGATPAKAGAQTIKAPAAQEIYPTGRGDKNEMIAAGQKEGSEEKGADNFTGGKTVSSGAEASKPAVDRGFGIKDGSYSPPYSPKESSTGSETEDGAGQGGFTANRGMPEAAENQKSLKGLKDGWERALESGKDGGKDEVARVAVNSQKGEIRMELLSTSLGRLRILLTLNENCLKALFHTDSSAVKEALQGSMVQLRDSLAGKDMNLGDFDVQTGDRDGLGGQNEEFGNGKKGLNWWGDEGGRDKYINEVNIRTKRNIVPGGIDVFI